MQREGSYICVATLPQARGQKLLRENGIHANLSIYKSKAARLIYGSNNKVTLYEWRDDKLWVHLAIAEPAYEALALTYPAQDIQDLRVESCTEHANEMHNEAGITTFKKATTLYRQIEEDDEDFVVHLLLDYEMMRLSYAVRGIDYSDD